MTHFVTLQQGTARVVLLHDEERKWKDQVRHRLSESSNTTVGNETTKALDMRNPLDSLLFDLADGRAQAAEAGCGG